MMDPAKVGTWDISLVLLFCSDVGSVSIVWSNLNVFVHRLHVYFQLLWQYAFCSQHLGRLRPFGKKHQMKNATHMRDIIYHTKICLKCTT